MHASIPTTHASLLFLCFLLFSLFFLPCSTSSSFFHLSFFLPFLVIFIVHSYHLLYCLLWWDLPFLPSIAFGSLWVSFQDCPLACQLLSYYHCSKCVGCITPHSQTKWLVLFLTFLFSLLSFVYGLSLSPTYLYGMHQLVSTHTYFFWVRCYPSSTFLRKEVWAGTPK